MPAWGSLRLALPIERQQRRLLSGRRGGGGRVGAAGAPATQGTGAVRTLVSAQPKLADNSLAEAMNTLLKPGDAATAPVHAVITTEQQLFQRGQSLSDAKSTLGSWLPPGPVPVADYPTVLLSGSWLSQEQTSAASEFARFMHKPEQLAKLAKAGFRVNGVKPPSSPVTSFAALPSTLSVGDDADARHAGRRHGRAVERTGRDDHARPVDAQRRRRKDPAGQRDCGAQRQDQGAAAHRRSWGCGPSTATRADQRWRPARWPTRSTANLARQR